MSAVSLGLEQIYQSGAEARALEGERNDSPAPTRGIAEPKRVESLSLPPRAARGVAP